MNKLHINLRTISVAAFSMLFAYLLSFLFEGQVLYSLLKHFDTHAIIYILIAIVAHFAGLFSCGFFVKTLKMAGQVMIIGIFTCLIVTTPFFFSPSKFWLMGLMLAGYASGCAVAAWGYFLKVFTTKDERLKSCADVLIISNLIMIGINMVSINISPFIGLMLSMLCLLIAGILVWYLNTEISKNWSVDDKKKLTSDLKKPMVLMVLFVVVITVNSGLMYQVINPAFEHLTGLVSWYWAVPYIIALVLMRNLPAKTRRSTFLYIGMAMIVAAFLCFMLLGRTAYDYIIIDTLMLGACGIFDLFWWSIIGEMLDFSENPVKIFGIGLSANVFGVLLGDVLGIVVTTIALPRAEIAVIALTVVCVTLIFLPPLNRELLMLLKSHAYLSVYEHLSQNDQNNIINKTKMLAPLTEREQEVLRLILSGKTNKVIAENLFISESTVKTHVHNIYSKYDVISRAELISTLLKNQSDT